MSLTLQHLILWMNVHYGWKASTHNLLRKVTRSSNAHLLMFCKYYNTDPDTLVRLKTDQIKNMVIEYIVQLKKVAKKYVTKAKRGEICMNSIKTYMMGIQSFLEFDEIALPWKKISKFSPPDIANNLRAYTTEEIIKILSVADLRDRCIILLMISTGIRVGAIKLLRIKHLKNGCQGQNRS